MIFEKSDVLVIFKFSPFLKIAEYQFSILLEVSLFSTNLAINSLNLMGSFLISFIMLANLLPISENRPPVSEFHFLGEDL